MTVQGFIFTVIAIALFVTVACMWAQGLKEIAQDEAEERLRKMLEETGRPLVKVDVEMRGKW